MIKWRLRRGENGFTHEFSDLADAIVWRLLNEPTNPRTTTFISWGSNPVWFRFGTFLMLYDQIRADRVKKFCLEKEWVYLDDEQVRILETEVRLNDDHYIVEECERRGGGRLLDSPKQPTPIGDQLLLL